MFRQGVQNAKVSVDPKAVQTFKVSKGGFSNCKGDYWENLLEELEEQRERRRGWSQSRRGLENLEMSATWKLTAVAHR